MALQATQGNKSAAARLLRVDYKTLHLKMKHYAPSRRGSSGRGDDGPGNLDYGDLEVCSSCLSTLWRSRHGPGAIAACRRGRPLLVGSLPPQGLATVDPDHRRRRFLSAESPYAPISKAPPFARAGLRDTTSARGCLCGHVPCFGCCGMRRLVGSTPVIVRDRRDREAREDEGVLARRRPDLWGRRPVRPPPPFSRASKRTRPDGPERPE